ncbi:hypothetical protein BYT27DRAFT_7252697 [Phlegmacium glaucopus]|nr:hypothetical protein BYT27DRAFT_7252697 [Phlegmacium glaucopus]
MHQAPQLHQEKLSTITPKYSTLPNEISRSITRLFRFTRPTKTSSRSHRVMLQGFHPSFHTIKQARRRENNGMNDDDYYIIDRYRFTPFHFVLTFYTQFRLSVPRPLNHYFVSSILVDSLEKTSAQITNALVDHATRRSQDTTRRSYTLIHATGRY